MWALVGAQGCRGGIESPAGVCGEGRRVRAWRVPCALTALGCVLARLLVLAHAELRVGSKGVEREEGRRGS